VFANVQTLKQNNYHMLNDFDLSNFKKSIFWQKDKNQNKYLNTFVISIKKDFILSFPIDKLLDIGQKTIKIVR